MDDQFGLRTKSQLSKSQLSNFQFPTSQLFCPHRRSKMKTAIVGKYTSSNPRVLGILSQSFYL